MLSRDVLAIDATEAARQIEAAIRGALQLIRYYGVLRGRGA